MSLLPKARLLPIAVRNLSRNRRRTLLTLAALALGVMGAVGARGFLNGLQQSLILGIVEGGQGALQIHHEGFLKSTEAVPLAPSLPHDAALLEKVLATEGVKAAVPRIAFAGMVNAGDESPFAFMLGTEPTAELKVNPLRREALVRGRWLEGESDLLMANELAAGIDVALWDTVALLTNDRDGVLNAMEGPLVGGLAALTQGEKRLVMLPLEKAQELLRMEGRVTEIAVALHDIDEAEAVKARLLHVLGPGYEVHTWQELAPLVADARELQNSVIRIVVGIFLFIILMGITNTMLMNVLERVREIGTLLAIGARRRQVLQLFVLEGALLGGLGALVGAVLGALLVLALGTFGVRLTTPGASAPQLIVPYVGLSFLVGMVLLGAIGAALATLYPAWRASRLTPSAALART